MAQNPNSTPAPGGSETPRPDPQSMAYEDARNELVGIVRALESGSAPLDETMKLWERGEALAARCQAVLDEATKRVERAESGATGADA